MLIGLGHTARVGKDTIAKVLVSDHGFTSLAFADALRDVAYASNPRVRDAVDRIGWDEAKVGYPWVRTYLVELGNACRNVLGEDVWVEAAFRQMKDDRDYVLTDVRYPNEVARVEDEGGTTVKVTRPGVEALPNIADRALASHAGWHFIIANDGTIDDLRIDVKELLARM